MRPLFVLSLVLALGPAARGQDPAAALTTSVLERMDRRLEAMSAQQQQATQHMAAIGQEIKALRADMGRYQARLDDVERRLAALEARPAGRALPPADLTVPQSSGYDLVRPVRPANDRPDSTRVRHPAVAPLPPPAAGYPPAMLIPASSPAFSPSGNYDHLVPPGSYLLIRIFEVR